MFSAPTTPPELILAGQPIPVWKPAKNVIIGFMESGPNPDNTAPLQHFKPYTLLIPLAFIAGLALGFMLWGRTPAPAAEQAGDSPPAAPAASKSAQQIRRYEVIEDDDPVIGPDNAAITIIEFSDYQCPYCAKWHAEVFGRLREEYPEQVRIIYRDFPLESIHPEAKPAAAAATCAHEQGKFWEYHDLLINAGNDLGQETYLAMAREVGLDSPSFQICIEEGRYLGEVQADLEYASGLGVRSTPTFFLNGIPLVGAQPYEIFQQVIEKELAGELD